MRHRCSRLLLPCLAIALGSLPANALAESAVSSVTFHGQPVFEVAAGNGLTSDQRAAVITRRLESWAPEHAPLHIEAARKGPVLMLGSEPLVMVTPDDAALKQAAPAAVAEEWKERLEGHSEPPPPQAPSSAPWQHGWGLVRHLLALLGMLLGGAIASWLVSWGTARLAEQPERYGLTISSAIVTVTGGLLSLALAVATIGACLAYLPVISSLPLMGAVIVLGAMVLIASAEWLGNLAGGAVIAWTPLFKLGDYVRIGGHAGRVQRIGACFTRLETERHGERLVPNSSVLRRGVAFTAPSSSSLFSQPVRLAYTVPRELAQAIIVEAALRTEGLVDEPFPECFLAELEEDVVRFDLRAWVAKGERPEAVKSRFHVNMLDVLAENGLAPTGAPLQRASLRIGLAPSGPDFPSF